MFFKCNSSAITLGILIARLFPHFFIVVTISVWIDSNSTPYWTANPDYYAIASAILEKGTGSAVDGYGIWFTKDNTINFASDSEGAGRSDLKSIIVLDLEQWYHIVVQRKSDVKYIFINGIQDLNTENVSGQEWSETSRPLFIGKHDVDPNYVNGNGWSQYFDGSISGVKIYNRALSDSEIKLLYDKGR